MREKLSPERQDPFVIIRALSQSINKMNKLVSEAIQTCKASTKQNRKSFAKTKRQFWQIMSQIRKSELILTDQEKSRLEICKFKMQ